MCRKVFCLWFVLFLPLARKRPDRHADRMTLAGFPRIAVDPLVCGGRPVVAGTRMRVTDLLGMLAGGAEVAEIVADFPYISEADVREALAFAARQVDHPVVLAAE